ncbi:MAG: Dyp-type peroxidase [Kofleriaceae bacterium]
MVAPPMMLEADQIQGLVVRGYGELHEAWFLLLHVRDRQRALQYLAGVANRVNRADQHPDGAALQIAFTARGLQELAVPDEILCSFSREFVEGMDVETRARGLGDIGVNQPSAWRWGQRTGRQFPPIPGDDAVHALLMIYGHEDAIGDQIADELARLTGAFAVLHQQDTVYLPDHKEHFGWRDGLSMPQIENVPKTGQHQHRDKPTWTPPLPAGEFVLGYENEYKCLTEVPTDIGKNGTYLVYRQYTQDVPELWRYLERHEGVALGAKMVGRWPNGAPIISADHDDPTLSTHNEFVYKKPDPVGLACPIGAHIRRANPRDDLASDRDDEDSTAMVRKHQMIRRGRPYGPPISRAMDVRELAHSHDDGIERGLHFICLVGDINRQFEVVQRNWIHSANFHGLFKDGDPISAVRQTADNPNNEFTVPADPVRKKYKTLPQFTQLVGGAYFFLPSIAALRVIARAPASSSSSTGSGSSDPSSTHLPPQ